MGFVELLLIGVGLSMDAFAVAVGKGLSMKRLDMGQALVIALFFGGFQALMPAIGWALGAQFAGVVESFSGWIAFGLLAFIGGKMIWDALHEDDAAAEHAPANAGTGEAASTEAGADTSTDAKAYANTNATAENAFMEPDGAGVSLDFRELFMLAIATSIDALAMGITFAFLRVNIVGAAAVIGITTFSLSLAGVAIGHQFGTRWEKPSTIIGGVVLILIGLKTLIGL